ncbi:FtsW/RodA/SpoVE family cell cycle protein [Lacticaseibacillus suilingensis]|uniref:FtsW/RodA/SpoVE family cell cycle protein n=1 Tax=Lacticaseibacillus suilingensis TaxID=2799577 RepID=A0ABW4BB69_9LACO|nr:FtsW/RodA/SpoVE family cell cycle protein [Lacticaseibacillus suilingensis]
MAKGEDLDSRIDYGIILSVMLLSIIGLVSLYTAVKYDLQPPSTPARAATMQLIWLMLGILVAFLAMHLDAEQYWKLSPWLYTLGIILLIAVLKFYDPTMAIQHGAKSWFRVGPISFQPSEIMKPAYILMTARVASLHNSMYSHTFKNDWILIGKFALITLPIAVLMKLQHDFGSTLVFVAILAGMILVSGIKWQIVLPLGLGSSLIICVSIYLVVSSWGKEFLGHLGFESYQFDRINSWLDPTHDTSNSSLQLWRSMQAIGTGQMTGRGMNNLKVYVPIRESDMIFSVIGESFGFVGCSLVILIYFLLLWQLIRVAFDTKNEFYAYIVTGIVMMLSFHIFENIGMNIDLLPLTGIPLPFISQGGSFLLTNMICIGIVLSMRYHHRTYMFSRTENDFTS